MGFDRGFSQFHHLAIEQLNANYKREGWILAAYLIAEVDVIDATMFDEYRKGVPATIAAYGGKYLVRGGKTEVGEGTWQPKRMIVLEFADMKKLKAWYHSKEYAPLMAMRKKAARTNVVMLEGT